MKNGLSPVLSGVIITVVVLVAIIGGFLYLRNATGSAPEDPNLLQKQLEVEHNRQPKPAASPTGGPNFREDEMKAREAHP